MQSSRELKIIDSHLHLWDTSRFNYSWLNTVPDINRNFFIADYQRATTNFCIEKMVFVQCECTPKQYLQEVAFVTEQAGIDNRIQGIVAYAPMEKGKDISQDLRLLSANSLVKGVRKMYDDNPEICYSKPFLDALNLLPLHNFSFDISCKPFALPATIKMIRSCPDTVFIIDHLGKPDIKNNGIAEYIKNMEVLASFPNVMAKISGLITEADPHIWTGSDLRPYVEYAITCFGYDRLMFGGDWPVVLLAGDFERWVNVLLSLLEDSSAEEVAKVFYTNAQRIYKL